MIPDRRRSPHPEVVQRAHDLRARIAAGRAAPDSQSWMRFLTGLDEAPVPRDVFDAVFRGGPARPFQVVARPGEAVPALVAGDLLLTRALGEGPLCAVQVVTGPVERREDVVARGARGRVTLPGLYAPVVSFGGKAGADEVVRVGDLFGRLRADQVVVSLARASSSPGALGVRGSWPGVAFDPSEAVEDGAPPDEPAPQADLVGWTPDDDGPEREGESAFDQDHESGLGVDDLMGYAERALLAVVKAQMNLLGKVAQEENPPDLAAFHPKALGKVTENLVRPFVDNEGLWGELTGFVEGLGKDVPVYVTQLLWEERLRTRFGETVPVGKDLARAVKADLLEEKLVGPKRKRLRNVRVVMWNNGLRTEDSIAFSRFPTTPSTSALSGPTDGVGIDFLLDDAKKVRERFPVDRVRGFVLLILEGVMHGKLVAAGERAYLLGSPFSQQYLDGAAADGLSHGLEDARRGTIPTTSASIRVPIHDVSVGLHGPAAEIVRAHVKECWNECDYEVDPSVPKSSTDLAGGPTAPTSWRKAKVQIARSLPGTGRFRLGTGSGSTERRRHGEEGILLAYEAAIAKADRYVYLETQYLTEPRIAHALGRRMVYSNVGGKGIHVILVINMRLDFPVYLAAQDLVVYKFRQWLEEQDQSAIWPNYRERVGIYTRWRLERVGKRLRIAPNYVHSKVGLVDDAWATVGSANLDQAGLTYSPVYEWLTRVDGRKVGDASRRSVEVNAVITPFDKDNNVPRDLRQTLWGEHVGAGHGDAATIAEPAALWKRRSEALVSAILANRTETSCILPYVRAVGSPTISEYLERAMGHALPDHLDVYDCARGYDLDKGEWEKDWKPEPREEGA